VREHHKTTIENLIKNFENDERFSAIIIGGSVAKKREAEDADIDIYLVATDKEFQKRQADNNYRYFTKDQNICISPCKCVEGKIVNLDFLLDAAKRGSEPIRASFSGAFIAYSRMKGLEEIIKQIPVYQEHEQKEKMKSFYSLVVTFNWFINEAEKRNDRFLLIRSTAELVLFGGRMILAYNKILYPYHKWFMHELINAPHKPDNFIELAKNLLKCPCKSNSDLFFNCIINYIEWEKIIGRFDPFNRFINDVEWNWLRAKPSVYDL